MENGSVAALGNHKADTVSFCRVLARPQPNTNERTVRDKNDSNETPSSHGDAMK